MCLSGQESSSVGKGMCGGSFRFYKYDRKRTFRLNQRASSFWEPRILVWRMAVGDDRSSMRYRVSLSRSSHSTIYIL